MELAKLPTRPFPLWTFFFPFLFLLFSWLLLLLLHFASFALYLLFLFRVLVVLVLRMRALFGGLLFIVAERKAGHFSHRIRQCAVWWAQHQPCAHCRCCCSACVLSGFDAIGNSDNLHCMYGQNVHRAQLKTYMQIVFCLIPFLCVAYIYFCLFVLFLLYFF